MKLKFYNWIIVFLSFIFLASLLYVFDISNRNFKIYFLDVGQGDSIYVRNKSLDILIDGGSANKVLPELGKYMPFFDRKIEYVILTHAHEDHIGGLVEIIKRYEIEQIIMTDKVSTSGEYIEFLNLIKQKNIKTILANDLENLTINDAINLDFFWPKIDTKNLSLNNSSIVCKLNYYNISILLTGDAENEVLIKIAQQFGNKLKSEILKMPHHGSKTANNELFISYSSPEFAIISVGEKNKFGHPHEETLSILNNLQIPILRTDKLGTIKFESEGLNFWTK